MRIKRYFDKPEPTTRSQIGHKLTLFVGLLLVAIGLLFRIPSPAYAWPGDLSAAWSSSEWDRTSSVVWADWDGDGDLDLTVGNAGEPNRFYRNEGADLTLVWSTSEWDRTSGLAWADWDGDGDLDLAVGNSREPSRVYSSTGQTLSLAWTAPLTDNTFSLAWGDWDGDGDLDLAVGNGDRDVGQPNRVYRNDGGSLSLAWSSPEVDSTYSVAWDDWDNDGDLDLAVGNWGAPNRVYRNDGGALTLAWSSPEADYTRQVAWGDWDNDGDLDLAVGNDGRDVDQPNRVYRNDGGSLTLAWSSPEADPTFSIAWGDWDGDGDLDLAVGNYGQPNRVYRNVGGMLDLAWTSIENDSTTSLAWGDWDNDGDLDLVAGNWNQPDRVYQNEGGGLASAWSADESDTTYSIAWGDWDNDGDLDLATGNYAHPNRVYRNEEGTLDLAWNSSEIDDTTSLAWGDWDGDGDLDLAVGNGEQSPNQVYRNDGNTLDLAWTSTETDTTTSLAWGDWDGDGDLDLAVGNTSHLDDNCDCWVAEPNRVYRNDGGSLTLAWSSTETDATTSLAWGDWDGDGDLDLAVGNAGYYDDSLESWTAEANRVYRNDGGSLALAWSSSEADETHSLAWGDWDGDGDLDLAVGNTLRYESFCDCWIEESNRVYRNDGGSLTLAWSSLERDYTLGIAWGDWDGDGDLDLAVANQYQPSRVYHNEGGNLSLAWSSSESGRSTSLVWGDWDGDSDLDLAVGNDGWPSGLTSQVYRNEGQPLGLTWSSPVTDSTYSTAWGDWDGDGDLDLAMGNWNQSNQVFRNEEGALPLAWSSSEPDKTSSLAWGDWDGDGDLDLAVGNDSQPNRVYRNDGGSLALAWSSVEADMTTSLAWGDWDGDEDLDLAVGNTSRYEGTCDCWVEQPNRLYRNDGGTLALAWSSVETDTTTSLAWGDWDGDGDLDLAVGNSDQPDRVYSNDGGELILAWTSRWNNTYSLAWGDWDSDGDLDLATGDDGGPNRVYSNVGGDLSEVWVSPQSDNTYGIAWGDWDNDGDLDLAVGNEAGQQNRVYRNDGGILTLAWSSSERDSTRDVAWGDWDGDGDFDLVVGNKGQSNRIYLNRSQQAQRLPNNPPSLVVAHPAHTRAANFYARPEILQGLIPITYTLFDPEADPVRFVRASYSLNGGGQWLPAVASADTITTGLSTLPFPQTGITNTYVFTWDTCASGFFGQSDDVVFRIEAYASLQPLAHSAAGPYQRPFVTAQTFPLRVRGSQVKVVSGTVPARDALVYRLPAGESGDAELIASSAGQPFHTNPQGYLQGRGQLSIGDRLVALAPITATDAYTLYYTSAAPTATSLEPYTITALGVQTLTVSPNNPLILFKLDVSLEWDARNDTTFLEQLEYDLQRASEVIYDVSNGQAALGDVTLYHDQQSWSEADVRIYATNALRPNADIGGLRTDTYTEVITTNPYAVATLPYTLTYRSGQVRMGSTWNRFGEASGTIGEDWPRTLAHELGHYLFYLYDNYIGLDEDGFVIPASGCDGSLMTNQYTDDYSEFHLVANWGAECGTTLSARRTGRADWETVTKFYPWLNPEPSNAGPAGLALAVTQVRVQDIVTEPTTLDVPIFYLTKAGASYQAGDYAQAILYQSDYLIDLGEPSLDKVRTWGASPGDRLCVYELDADPSTSLGTSLLGCETIAEGDSYLALSDVSGWQPDIIITPITSRTVDITVTASGVATDTVLQGRLYPVNDVATDVQMLTPVTEASGTYTVTFTLDLPCDQGYLQVWVDEAEPRREIVTNYALGGNPGAIIEGFGAIIEGFAPAASTDGQVVLYGDVDFEEGQFYALQKATVLPELPAWTTVVGEGYRLMASPNAPSFAGTSINFRYLGEEVPSGEENFLSIYYWDGKTWEKLSTNLNTEYNEAAAATRDAGLYVLASSLEIPLETSGWNLFAYPVQATRAVTEALLSISGIYTTVYGYDATDTEDPWKVYDVTAPGYVNQLRNLEYGKGYWINVSQAITLYLKGTSESEATALAAGSGMGGPPTTYYGLVLPGQDFAPTAGMTVTAWIGDNPCGQGETLEVEQTGSSPQIVYHIDVFAEFTDWRGNSNGCGAPGRQVTFRVDSQLMSPTAAWDNSRLWELPLGPVSPSAAQLEITKTVTPKEGVYPGDMVTYTIILNNIGTEPALGVQLTDTLPEQLYFGNWVEQPGSASAKGRNINWYGDIAPAGVVTFTFTAGIWPNTVFIPLTITNTAAFTSSNANAGSANAVFVMAEPALALTKVVTPETDVPLGGVVTYTLRLENSSATPANGVVMTDTLPGEVTLGGWIARPEGTTWTSRAITWTGTVTYGNMRTFVFTATASDDEGFYGQVIENTAFFISANAQSGSAQASFIVSGGGFRVYLPLVLRNENAR